ncbi:hypothetical protein Glove_365g161 [Diversispora epigaea]|uniref:Tetratricopeptide repeat protein n=1 Tax=Diversispora epigaea TaxID=1348612 RepID=A0A397H8S4_9GLOM|nr:hypothetical protein Glove_365g161 [Diversispora epigaea]
MKLTGEKNIVSLLKKSFAKVYPKDSQTESPKKSPLRHLKITNLKSTMKKILEQKSNRAINDLNSAILLKPERPAAWYLRGAIKGLENDAINDLSKAIRIDPINCFALKSRAYCYYQLNSLEETLCDLNMVIILGCSDENTYINKANILRELKEKIIQ